MKRREFIAGLASAVAWPMKTRAQQSERIRHIGVLMSTNAEDEDGRARSVSFLRALNELGWTEGRNLRIDTRWGGAGDHERMRRHAAEMVALGPDLIMATGADAVAPLLQASRSIPVVFAVVPDPIGAGFVNSLARPGGNATGFTSFEYGIGAKWLELLTEVAPGIRRVAVIRDPGISAGIGQFGAVQAMAPSVGVEVNAVNVRDASEIERSLETFALLPNGGMVVTGSASAVLHRELIVTLGAKYKLPTVYYRRVFVTAGGLMSFGPDFLDQYRRAADYVDRILKGEKPGNLPVQAPTKYELVLNLKTAKALSVTIPPTLLARADEVIE
jgi:putative tryptophan/tyrosine transport system substrate-binding protein